MIHGKRTFHVGAVATPEELAEKLTGSTWTLCTGFELDGVLFLNDSFSEDSAQEYAVIEDGHQVESITFSWCDRPQAEQHIRTIIAGAGVDMGPTRPKVDASSRHSCHLCR